MKTYLSLNVLSVLLLLSLTSCDKDERDELALNDNLEQTGILGTWNRTGRIINGITDMIVACCDTIDFKANSEANDLRGEFYAHGLQYERNGSFEINNANDTIVFQYGDTQLSYALALSANRMTFSYSENNANFITDWIKLE